MACALRTGAAAWAHVAQRSLHGVRPITTARMAWGGLSSIRKAELFAPVTVSIGARYAHAHPDTPTAPAALRELVTNKHKIALEHLFQHPTNLNIHWRDVEKLIESIGGEVSETHKGRYKIKLNHHTAAFAVPVHGTITSKEDVIALRHFLQDAYSEERKGAGEGSAAAGSTQYLVMLDGKQTKIYHTLVRGEKPQVSSHSFHPADAHSAKQSEADRHSAFAEVAKALEPAEEILVTGHGKGKSSAPHQFIADVNKYAPKLAKKVVGILPIDEKHVTENQLLAAAAHFYENKNL